MLSDALASAHLTASACWVIATYSLAFGSSHRESLQIALGMSTWFATVVWIASSELIKGVLIVGVPAIGFMVAGPIALLTTCLLMTDGGRRRLMAASFPALVSVQILRVLGFWFLVLLSANRLPPPFAPVAGWGDILAGVLAAPAALAARSPSSNYWPIMIWNIIGAVDLVAAVSLGLSSFPGPLQIFQKKPDSVLMTTLPWLIIPGFLVPSLLTLHAATFYRLAHSDGASTQTKKSK